MFFNFYTLISRSYCCIPGGGYFEDDIAIEPFDKYGLFHSFRTEVGESSMKVTPEEEDKFFRNSSNFYLLQGYTVDGNPLSKKINISYRAFFENNKNVNKKSSSPSRIRRGVGVLTMPTKTTYEFGGEHVYPNYEKAIQAKEKMLKDLKKQYSEDSDIYSDAVRSEPRRTQKNFDSSKTMFEFHKKAIEYIEDHVKTSNPDFPAGRKRSARVYL